MSQDQVATSLIATQGIELLTSTTANGFRVSILLEELKEAYGIDYTVQNIDFAKRIQKQPWYMALNPNGQVPTIVDHDENGFVVMEGIAIIKYLVRKLDKQFKFSFSNELDISTTEQWVSWQQGNLGPNQVLAFYYYRYLPQRHAYPTQDFVGKTERNYSILDQRLADRDYISGPGRGRYSVADMAIFPFADAVGAIGLDLERFPNVLKWWERVGLRPAVRKGVCAPSGKPFPFSREVLMERKERDLEAWEEAEQPFREALEKAKTEFGDGK